MEYIVLAILFLLSGFFMKYSDDLFDSKHDLKFAGIFGVLCAIVSACATIYSTEAAYIFIAILLGNLIALKVDGIHHIITLVLFVLICLIGGIPELSYVILLICILAAFEDEVGHELILKVTDNKFLNLFFEYRFLMKVVILLLAICGVFSIWIFLCFLSFEIAYEIAGIIFEKLN
ncbi:MAG: hypothetical protein ACI389_07090 [Methanobrevibacter sp.]|uniref:hypothetical protein n=1 Tax=Methanobrevibacter sp. TaxID=66852 RepID=UPI003F04316F